MTIFWAKKSFFGLFEKRRRRDSELCPSTLGSCDSPTTWKTARFFILLTFWRSLLKGLFCYYLIEHSILVYWQNLSGYLSLCSRFCKVLFIGNLDKLTKAFVKMNAISIFKWTFFWSYSVLERFLQQNWRRILNFGYFPFKGCFK